jgi:hypothetical protein
MRSPAEEAEEHLRIIRGLMERATFYRSLSAPTALMAGMLSFSATGVALYLDRAIIDPNVFLWLWATVLAGVLGFNTWLIWKSASFRGESVLSPGLRMALMSFTPPLAAGGVLTLWFMSHPDILIMACLWNTFYGLALLATAHFAPRSLVVLGWCFLATGAGLPAFRLWIHDPITQNTIGLYAMGVSFGFYHFIYAVWVGSFASRPAD